MAPLGFTKEVADEHISLYAWLRISAGLTLFKLSDATLLGAVYKLRYHFISIEGALKRPMTYDDYPIPSIPHIALKKTFQSKMKKDRKTER